MYQGIDKSRTVEDLQDAIGQAAEAGDLGALQELQKYFVETDVPREAPFVPAIALDDSKLEITKATAESSFAIEMANSLDRATRLLQYNARIRSGYDGPIIVSEGDSWFQYPFFLTDIIDNINDKYAVLSLGGAGHHLSDMVLNQDEFKPAICAFVADFYPAERWRQ